MACAPTFLSSGSSRSVAICAMKPENEGAVKGRFPAVVAKTVGAARWTAHRSKCTPSVHAFRTLTFVHAQKYFQMFKNVCQNIVKIPSELRGGGYFDLAGDSPVILPLRELSLSPHAGAPKRQPPCTTIGSMNLSVHASRVSSAAAQPCPLRCQRST